jgi:O-antigen/teichoic acid export membrane protein
VFRRLKELRSSPTIHMSGAKAAAAAAAAVVVFGTSRLLVPADRGDLAAALAGANLAAAVLSGSIWLGTSIELRRHSDMPGAARVFAILYPALLGALALPLAAIFVSGRSPGVWLWAITAALVLTSYSLLQALALGSADIRGYAIAEIVRSSPSAILCVVAAGVTGKVVWAVAGWAMGPVFGSIYLFVRAPATQARMKLSRYLKVVGPQSLRAHGGNILGVLSLRFDIVLLAAISSTTEVAYYSLAVAFGEAMWIVSSARGTVHLSEQIQGHPGLARAHAIAVLKRLMLFMAGLALILELFGGFAVTLFAGAKYEAAIWPMRVTVIGCGLFAVAHVVMPYLVAGLRRPGLLTGIGVITVTVNFALLLLLAPGMGALGAAIASAVAYALTAAVSLALLLHPRFEKAAGPVDPEQTEVSPDSPTVLGGMAG